MMSWAVWAQEGEEATPIYEAPETPAIITLAQIPPDPEFGHFYGPAEFNHILHEGFGCEMCHHYFDMHSTEGIILKDRRTQDNCSSCHHMDAAPYEEPMDCYMCHQEGELDAFLGVKSNFPCWYCHEIEMKMQPRIVEIKDEDTGIEGLYLLPALKALYHQNCLECHKDYGASTECTYCHEPKEMTE